MSPTKKQIPVGVNSKTMDVWQNYQHSTVTSESWGTGLHSQNTHLLYEFPSESQNKSTCGAAQKEFVILETIRGLVPKCVPQLFLG